MNTNSGAPYHGALQPLRTVEVHGMPLAALTADTLLEHVEAALSRGDGGWIVTANLDILSRFSRDPQAREAYLAADLRVADGMPLLWAARLRGERLPERVAGSSLCEPLLELCARRGWPALLLGGQPGAAERVEALLSERHPTLRLEAHSDVQFSTPPQQRELAVADHHILHSASRVVLVGLGSPKQEFVIQRLRSQHPGVWFMGVGGSFSFLAGYVERAPLLVQRAGLEWLHRLAQEPRRLARRYLMDNVPFALRLLTSAAWARRPRAGGRR